MVFEVLCPGTPEGSTGCGSGFKASQKTGNGLKSHPTDWEKPGMEPVTPGLQDIGLSPTPRRLPIMMYFLSCIKCLSHMSGLIYITFMDLVEQFQVEEVLILKFKQSIKWWK